MLNLSAQNKGVCLGYINRNIFPSFVFFSKSSFQIPLGAKFIELKL